MLALLFALAAIAWAVGLFGCTINVERVQVGPDRFGPNEPTTIVEIPDEPDEDD